MKIGNQPLVVHYMAERGLEVIDGTCTWVVQEHRELAKLVEEGYEIVLLGTP
ncbi:MAG: 4-hydroxy-3-methylbut-2-enyl diphosphate reductase, partial [Candidatus Limnocylindrus sp.]